MVTTRHATGLEKRQYCIAILPNTLYMQCRCVGGAMVVQSVPCAHWKCAVKHNLMDKTHDSFSTIRWTKPIIVLVQFDGKKNIIVLVQFDTQNPYRPNRFSNAPQSKMTKPDKAL